MRRPEPPITAFRRRLLRLIDEQCEGRYTALARRAGIPTSTMEHYIHHAKHLPGGEHLQKLAEALGVSVQYLVAGDEAVHPVDPPPPAPVAVPQEGLPPAGIATHVTIPLFACGCPGICLLAAEVPVATRRSTVLVDADLVPMHPEHRLVVVQVGEGLPAAEWPEGARLVLDRDARPPSWEALALIHAEGRCQLGHLNQIEDAIFFSGQVDGECRVFLSGWKILGTIVAAVTRL